MYAVSFINILDICLVAKGPDPLGEVSWGCLRLACCMLVDAESTDPDESGDVLLRSIPEIKWGNKERKIRRVFGTVSDARRECFLLFVNPFGYGLLLEPTTLKKGQYKRLGIF